MILVSIITATFNSERYIRNTYLSLLKQSYENWEWIVTDDASSDKTWDILLELSSKDKRIKLQRNETNRGAAFSRNFCIDHAIGEYIAFIDSDDLWSHEKLYSQLAFMKENSFDFTFTAYELIDDNGEKIGKTVDTTNTGNFGYVDMLKKAATMGCSTVMINRDFLGSNRMPDFRTGQDYAFWLQLLKPGNKAYILPRALTMYRISHNSLSRNKFKKALRQWEIYRYSEAIGYTRSVYYFLFYAFRALVRKA